MSSIKNFFPTVGGLSNKRQKLTETAFAAISTVVSDGTQPSSSESISDDIPLKSSGETPVAAPEVTATSTVTSVPLTGFQPFDEMEISWRSRLYAERNKPYFQSLLTFLDQEYRTKTVFPPKSQIFTALNLCTYDKVKVVIIGQDPYHGAGQAHGLAFSVQHGVTVPPSLRNMISEAHNDVGIVKPKHGNLEHWSRQGVLLLNNVLTVRQAEANSHQKKGWEEFTDAIVKELRKKQGIVYLLWGKPAQSKCTGIDTKHNKIIQSSHPSPLSATKTNEPFMGSKMFSRCNKALKDLGEEPIDWSIL